MEVKEVLSLEITQSQVDLKSIDVDAVFESLRATTSFFRIVNESGDDILTQCPFHGFGNEQHPSFGICHNRANPHYGKYHCFACGVKGTIISLVNHLSNRNPGDSYGIDYIRSVSEIAFLDRRGIRTLAPREPIKPEQVTEVELMSFRSSAVPYLTDQRRIKPIIQKAFDTGFDPVANAVTFPVKRVDGSVAFVVRRGVDKKWYNYPAGVDKPVYGVFESNRIIPVNSRFARRIVLVESIINALTLWGYGIPAWALLGTGSQVQIDFLNSTNIREFPLCLDGDKAGQDGAMKLQKKLKARTPLIPMLPGKDVNDLDEYTMRILYTLRR